MQCEQLPTSADICLTKEQTLGQLIKLLPRGRAWQTDANTPVRLAVLDAIADVYSYIEDRLCDLRLEFFCQTQIETTDVWLAEYGLPAPCDPFPDLCNKVAAVGGTRCEYFIEMAARAGWVIRCVELIDCGMRVCDDLCIDTQVGGGIGAGKLLIEVDRENSPAYNGTFYRQPVAGCMQAGDYLVCEPDISSLECLLARIVQAHIEIVYIFADPNASLVETIDYRFASEEVDDIEDYGLASDPVTETIDFGTAS